MRTEKKMTEARKATALRFLSLSAVFLFLTPLDPSLGAVSGRLAGVNKHSPGEAASGSPSDAGKRTPAAKSGRIDAVEQGTPDGSQRTGDGAPADSSTQPRIHTGSLLLGIAATFLAKRLWQRQLVRVVAKRTTEIETSLRSQSEFLAMMSHEIRTPMNGVTGMIDAVLATNLTPEQRQYLEFGKTSAESLVVVLNDVLEFSKLESGKLEIERLAFDLRKTLDNALVPQLLRARLKGLKLTCDVDPEIPKTVVGDPTRIGQVLINLVGNAVKFTPTGSITVSVTSVAKEQGDELLRFAVTDSGIGIPKDRIGKLFKPFSQADGSVARNFGGTGLGLSISHRLVDLMGGTISVESEVGTGSTFSFTLPLPAGPDLAVSRSHTDERTVSSHAGQPLAILLAEDNPINQLVIQAMLKSTNWSLTVVANGQDAIQASQAQRFDLVLMDIHMPEMDGLTATSLIRKDERTDTHLPIIALTANAMHEDRERCLAAGMDDYLSKPIIRGEFFAKIESVLAQYQPGEQAPATRDTELQMQGN
jgi:signal transduction histidine kinase/CheY-like chemotaxis protein